MLAILMKNSDINSLNIFNEQLIISQLADDTTIFLKNPEQIPEVLKYVDLLSEASGLTLNHNKCELMAIHNCSLPKIINLTKDNGISERLNIHSKITQCELKLNLWLQRDLTIFGRTYLTKMESLATCIYPAYSMAIPDKIIRSINQLNFNYIWKKRSTLNEKNCH